MMKKAHLAGILDGNVSNPETCKVGNNGLFVGYCEFVLCLCYFELCKKLLKISRIISGLFDIFCPSQREQL